MSAQPIICQYDTIAVDQYQGTSEDNELVLLALRSYGFVLRKPDMQLRRHSFAEFADAIEAVYSQSVPQNAAIVSGLRLVHSRNN